LLLRIALPFGGVGDDREGAYSLDSAPPFVIEWAPSGRSLDVGGRKSNLEAVLPPVDIE